MVLSRLMGLSLSLSSHLGGGGVGRCDICLISPNGAGRVQLAAAFGSWLRRAFHLIQIPKGSKIVRVRLCKAHCQVKESQWYMKSCESNHGCFCPVKELQNDEGPYVPKPAVELNTTLVRKILIHLSSPNLIE